MGNTTNKTQELASEQYFKNQGEKNPHQNQGELLQFSQVPKKAFHRRSKRFETPEEIKLSIKRCDRFSSISMKRKMMPVELEKLLRMQKYMTKANFVFDSSNGKLLSKKSSRISCLRDLVIGGGWSTTRERIGTIAEQIGHNIKKITHLTILLPYIRITSGGLDFKSLTEQIGRNFRSLKYLKIDMMNLPSSELNQDTDSLEPTIKKKLKRLEFLQIICYDYFRTTAKQISRLPLGVHHAPEVLKHFFSFRKMKLHEEGIKPFVQMSHPRSTHLENFHFYYYSNMLEKDLRFLVNVIQNRLQAPRDLNFHFYNYTEPKTAIYQIKNDILIYFDQNIVSSILLKTQSQRREEWVAQLEPVFVLLHSLLKKFELLQTRFESTVSILEPLML